MANSPTEFPALGSRYEDEHGPIDLEVYQVARDLWPAAEAFGRFALQDTAVASDLMFKAAAKVTERIAGGGPPIKNLKAYLFQTYKRLVGNEKARRLRHEQPLAELEPSVVVDVVADLERKIMLRELFSRMDEVERMLSFYRMLGYTYEEIAARMGMPADVLRSRFSDLSGRLGRNVRKTSK